MLGSKIVKFGTYLAWQFNDFYYNMLIFCEIVFFTDYFFVTLHAILDFLYLLNYVESWLLQNI